MKLSIICVNLNIKNFYSTRAKYDQVLTYLHEEAPQVEHEIILVDNGSDDDSVEFFKNKWGKTVNVISLDKNYGFHIGNNTGFKVAKGEYVMVHNPDIKVRKGDIDNMVQYLEAHPDVALLCPQLASPDGTVQDTYRKFYRPLDFIIKRMKFLHKIPYFKNRMTRLLMWNMDKSKVQEVDWVVGACMVIPRDKFEEIGWYDELYHSYMGDTDIAKQFWAKGWKVIYNPEIKATHGAKRSSGNGFWKSLVKKTAWIHLIDMLRYFWKWKGRLEREEGGRK